MVWAGGCCTMLDPDLETVRSSCHSLHSGHAAHYCSDSEEEDLRAEQLLLKDKWRAIFDQFDPEGFGEIPWPELLTVVHTEEFRCQVPPEKVESLVQLAYKFSSSTSALTFQQFVNVMSGKRTPSFTSAVHWRERGVSLHGSKPGQRDTCLGTLNSVVSHEVLSHPRDRKYHASSYRCWPPPWLVPAVSAAQLGLYCYYGLQGVTWPQTGDAGDWADIRLDSVLVYCPHRKRELWRFLSYCLVHSSWWHLVFNLVVQLVLGLPLEMVHGTARTAIIYGAGVLAGSLSTSVLDPGTCLVGASGGVYSLLAGHTAHLVTNYGDTRHPGTRLLAALTIASVEVGVAVYRRYDAPSSSMPPLSYLAHISGSLAGVSIGLVILTNFQQKLWERWVWWTALFSYSAFVMATFVANLIM